MPRIARYFLAFALALFAVASTAAERVTYFVPDAQGSPVAAMDAQGNLLWRESYAPYGHRQTRPAENNARPAYTGKPEDADTGLVYMGARAYDPETARFTGIDPQGFSDTVPQSFGRYVYANNSPYVYIDPDGELPILIPVAVFLAKEGAGYAVEAATGVSLPFTLKGLAKGIRKANQALGGRSASASVGPVPTRHGDAHQGLDQDSLLARQSIENGAPLFRVGTLGKSDAAEGQYWAVLRPDTPGYANGYGIPGDNLSGMNFMITGTLKKGEDFVTRPAPGIAGSKGGLIEAVTNPGGVQVNSFTMSPPRLR